MAFTNLAKIRRVLGIPAAVTTHDSLIEQLVGVADALILDEIDLPVETVGTYTEKIDVDYDGMDSVALRYRPVVSVVALTIGTSLAGTDTYRFTSSGSIELTSDGSYFPVGKQKVDITYTAGFSTTPNDLAHAATLICASMFNQGGHSGFKNERVGTYTYNISDHMIPPLAQRIINRYRRAFARSKY